MADKRLGTTKVNGDTYVRYMKPDGEIYFDPPLPEDPRLKANLQEMVECGKGPDLRGTDSGMFAGFKGRTLADQYKHDPEGLKLLIKAAKAQGYTPSPNDVYMPHLATRKGQPSAFIKSAGDLKRECIRQGRTMTGNVTVTEADVAATRAKQDDKPKKKVRIAEDIVQERLQEKVAKNPELALNKKKLVEARNDIIETHANK